MGRREGGLKAAAKNLANNPNFYKEIGAKGGSRRVTKGFGSMTREERIENGRKGGSVTGKDYKRNKGTIWESDLSSANTKSNTNTTKESANTCRGCLALRMVNESGLCARCAELDSDGTLTPLLDVADELNGKPKGWWRR